MNEYIIKNYLSKIDYSDTFSTQIKEEKNIEELYLKLVSKKSKLVVVLMSIRNKIVSFFKIKSVESTNQENTISVGKKVGLFTIYEISDNYIVSGEKDKHLDFCIVLKKENKKIYLSTYVKYNNFFGKVYMNIIKSLHKILVKKSLKELV
ncbi:DUF2867 domain-containing protein [Halarcobacter sp.]|uniref:DUF2867 domain-containing protein n=1 Tax=Halarcobacter sp. TaxID=2321133 RepID=UPI0029F5AFDB|nr:DUF2867 domain-containing protein [Halarcobacter sp.]